MNIFFHIGTEKTGSSYLQSLAGNNRQKLMDQGVLFPEGQLESQMLKGEISSGNAQDITDALNREDINFCSTIMANHLLEAEKNGCHSILLSNELLVLALAKENRLNHFSGMLKNNDLINHIKYSLILRDPVDQALSLYKHRAKSGNAVEIEDWPSANYSYGRGLLSFFEKAEAANIDLTCRKFSKKSGALEKIVFDDWLGIDIEMDLPKKLVNPSLSLSELLLLRKVKEKNPLLGEVLYYRLLDINKSEKAENSGIEQYHQDILSEYLEKFNKTWKICNDHLPNNEKINYPTGAGRKTSIEDKISSFSETQINTVSSIISDSVSVKFKLKIEWLKFRRRLGALKNSIRK